MITKKQLREMGWTSQMILDFLPEPKTKPSPTSKKVIPIQYWDDLDVQYVMKTNDFFIKRKETEIEKIKNKPVVLSRKDNLIIKWLNKKINDTNIIVLTELELMNRTLSEKQEWYDLWEDKFGKQKRNVSFDLDSIQRWEVNYIRHELIDYDETLISLFKRDSYQKYYNTYKKAILEKIKEVYPFLSYECDIQISNLERKV